MPSNGRLKLWSQRDLDYDPDMWELLYMGYKYLSGVPDDELVRRHNEIIRNMHTWGTSDRDVIPINTPLSSWYWYKKEHDVRLEAARRSPAIEIAPYTPGIRTDLVPAPAIVSGRRDGAYRYAREKYNREFIFDGAIRFTPAKNFDDLVGDESRRDDELRKHWRMPSAYSKIVTEDGREFRLESDPTRTVSGTNYHCLCAANIWHVDLFKDFAERDEAFAETCLVILDTEEFGRRLVAATKEHHFQSWYYHDCPIQYFDPYLLHRNERVDPAMSKDFSYAYQHEHRFLFAQMNSAPLDGIQYLQIGSATDIMKLYDRFGNEISR